MKKILKKVLFLVILSPALSYGQTDTLTLSQMKQGIEHMKMNLDKAQYRYSLGTTVLITGSIFCAFAVVSGTTSDGGWGGFETSISAIGGAIMLTGVIFMIDSHKYIGRAGRWQYTGNGITYSLH